MYLCGQSNVNSEVRHMIFGKSNFVLEQCTCQYHTHSNFLYFIVSKKKSYVWTCTDNFIGIDSRDFARTTCWCVFALWTGPTCRTTSASKHSSTFRKRKKRGATSRCEFFPSSCTYSRVAQDSIYVWNVVSNCRLWSSMQCRASRGQLLSRTAV